MQEHFLDMRIEALGKIRGLLYPQSQDLKREVYKYLSVLCDILLESKKGMDERKFDICHVDGEQEIRGDMCFQYAESIISELGEISRGRQDKKRTRNHSGAAGLI